MLFYFFFLTKFSLCRRSFLCLNPCFLDLYLNSRCTFLCCNLFIILNFLFRRGEISLFSLSWCCLKKFCELLFYIFCSVLSLLFLFLISFYILTNWVLIINESIRSCRRLLLCCFEKCSNFLFNFSREFLSQILFLKSVSSFFLCNLISFLISHFPLL